MQQVRETEVIRTAEEILAYLKRHPEAMDTLDGIVRWWIPRQRIEESVQTVHKALDYLVKKKQIARRFTVAGDAVYGKNRRKQN